MTGPWALCAQRCPRALAQRFIPGSGAPSFHLGTVRSPAPPSAQADHGVLGFPKEAGINRGSWHLPRFLAGHCQHALSSGQEELRTSGDDVSFLLPLSGMDRGPLAGWHPFLQGLKRDREPSRAWPASAQGQGGTATHMEQEAPQLCLPWAGQGSHGEEAGRAPPCTRSPGVV